MKEIIFEKEKDKIAVIGLGYVGLPMAALFAKEYNVIGFDINSKRIEELKKGIDKTREVKTETLKNSKIFFTDNPQKLKEAKVFIITVPTPIDSHNIPDLKPVFSATETVGKYISKGSIIVYESTVYPGLTEEECVPILEKESGLKWKKDFFVGYSPERVNPGDIEHTVDKIKKVVAGDTKDTTEFLARLYGEVIKAGIHKAPNIKTAEAAKVIENTQRDLNIALINELSMIFNKMGIDTKEVLEAASTKWNFLRFEPGLVGGHCIGVDPYYLTFKAQSIGHHPEVILSGRRVNDSMGKYVAENTVKMMIKSGKTIRNSKVLILGLTFKENISDIRNSKVVDIYNELKKYGVNIYVYDPMAYPEEVEKEYGIKLSKDVNYGKPYDAVIFAVKHNIIIDNFSLDKIKNISSKKPTLIDVKGVFDKEKAIAKGFTYWRL
ncbi:MAG: nucleotide sugar dehydrogenase [Elusimicrobiota bacterium]